MSRARHYGGNVARTVTTASRRLLVLGLVVAVLVGGALVAEHVGSRAAPSTSLQPLAVASEAAPAGSASSSWYCTGGTGPASTLARSSVLVVNDGRRRVTGTLTVTGGTGKTAAAPLSVAARGQLDDDPGTLVPGDWLASRVVVSGGAVTVSDLVDGPSGWAVTPCATETSASWYFATGSTRTGNQLYVSLFNPTASLAVVDLSFLTSRGVDQPQPFQGLVLAPGAVATAEVASYVQDDAAVATEVSARSGRVVASELQIYGAGGLSGMSLRLGAPALASAWDLPCSDDAEGGTSQLAVYNPSSVAEHVRVAVQLPSGPVAPFEETVAAGTVWTLDTSQQTRIPLATEYAVQVTSTGGPGVVVERTEAGSLSTSPQWDAVSGVAGEATLPAGHWVVPSLAATAAPGGRAPLTLTLQDTTGRAVTATVSALTRPGLRPLRGLRSVRLAAHAFRVVTIDTSSPVQVDADGPLAVMADAPVGLSTSVVDVPAASEP